MAMPDFQSIFKPFLEYTKDGKEHTLKETTAYLADYFKLTEGERTELLDSGKQYKFNNRCAWTRTYLGKAGLIESPQKGSFNITERGLQVLQEDPPKLTVKYLKKFEEFKDFHQVKTTQPPEHEEEPGNGETDDPPEEMIEKGYLSLRETLAADILDHIKNCSPSFFEQLVVDLMVAMGYGGSRSDAGRAIGRVGDGGIDGIIKEDKLGLDVIYLQAKRWENTVGSPVVQAFAGSLEGVRANKGVMITTSCFSRDAMEYVEKIGKKIVLIDGQRLANLMIDHQLGVSTVASYEIKKLDVDYFIEE